MGSLAINGVTMKPVVQYFGLDGIPRELAAELEVAVHTFEADADDTIEALKKEQLFSGADWDLVRSYLPQFEIPKVKQEKVTLKGIGAPPPEDGDEDQGA